MSNIFTFGLKYCIGTMPQTRKRQSLSVGEVLNQVKRSRSSSSASSRKSNEDSSFSLKRCKIWFHEYASAEKSDVIGPEGMEKFCEDIGVEPENVVMLCLAWKLKAEQMGFFTLNEWVRGMTELQCDSTEKLKCKLDDLRGLLSDPVAFKNIFRFAYDFAKDNSQRSLDTATATAMLALLLGRRWQLLPHFHQFLEQSKYKIVNRDQWYNILEFTRMVAPDLCNYDEDGAWPVMLDEFVEWYRQVSRCSASDADVSTS